ncbi:hypothetical protein [Povalibacter uvarum]|nr:hypothetical protein [Povalibacter uvarum]
MLNRVGSGDTANYMKPVRLSDVLELPVAGRLKLVEASKNGF